VELEVIPQEARQRLDQIGGADLVIGIIGAESAPKIGSAIEPVNRALASLSAGVKTVVFHNASHDEVSAQLHDPEGNGSSLWIGYPGLTPNQPVSPAQSIVEAYRTVFTLSDGLKARACVLIASDLETVTAQWISRLVQPILERKFDLVAPCYARNKFEGLINSAIISPLIRSLYGRRIQNPMGPDCGISAALLQRFVDHGSSPPSSGRARPPMSIATDAICGSFQICQAYVGRRFYSSTDSMNLSSVITEVLGPLFLDIERNAAFWQRVRGSQPIPTFGDPLPVAEEIGTVDVRRMIESFQLGSENLQEIWGLVLPPATLFELKKLARVAPDRFRIPDELWARIVYDFTLAHRLRIINRDHLLRAMTPLYLGWTASYALEMETAVPAVVEQRLERLCLAYEAGKTYFLSRWRWPDRFNP